MVFIEPIDDGIFASNGITVKCNCGNFITIPESKQDHVIVCPTCGKKI